MDRHVSEIFESVAAYAGTIQESIELIESDRECVRSGYNLVFAVDFDEIRQYLSPATVLPAELAVSLLPGESVQAAFVRQQLALGFIFRHLGHDLLILPPHQIEMSDHFHMCHSLHAPPLPRDLTGIDDDLAKVLTEHKSFRATAAMLEKDPVSENLSATQLRKVAALVRSHFRELSYLVGPHPAARAGMTEPVRHILRRHRIRPYGDYFSHSELQFDTVFDASAVWFDRLKDGSDPRLESAAYTDSLACAYLERTNAVINPKKEVLLFITGSRSVAAALREREILRGEGPMDRRTIVRDLNYFFALLEHRRWDPQEMDDALGRTSRHLENVLRVCRSAADAKAEELPPSFEKAVAGTLQTITDELRARENLSLALAVQAVPPGEEGGGSVANLSARLSNGLRNILRLATSHADVSRWVRDDLGRSDRELGEEISNLDFLTNAFRRSVRNIHDVRSHVDPEGSRFVLESPGSEMPAELHLYNPQVQRIASTLLTHEGERISNKSWQGLILSLAAVRERDPELHTLRAYLFAATENWSSALTEVRLTLGGPAIRTNGRIELLHLATVLHRVQEETEEGLRSCSEGLALAPSDPRLEHERAMLLTQVMQAPHPGDRRRWSGLVTGLFGREPDYAMALECAGRALTALERSGPNGARTAHRGLYVHSLNTSAAIALELFRIRRDVSYLILAEQRMAALRAALPEREWVKRFFHTTGCVLYERWDLTRERIDDLRAAKQYLRQAADGLSVSASEQVRFEGDLERVSTQLLKLGYSDQGEIRPSLRESVA